ncbi:SDR family oxidoreductase [Streptacidiphilus jiangxiensis]|uniref:SDR family oxidoreductase n=1 Tax=Streptacidiphilus jiangxiensis TaxID=235985 RepID=UPI0006942A1F|nr:SDR family oxidoreductase [Streptacidiphilus jiangxiensis]
MNAELDGRTVLVAGGAGLAGTGVVRSLLAAGAQVAVPSRSAERLERLRAEAPDGTVDRLHTFVADIGDSAGVAAFRDRLLAHAAFGRLDGVVASLGTWWQGKNLTEATDKEWEESLHSNLTVHFLVARAFVPLLTDHEQSVYLTLNGVAATQPLRKSGLISIAGAAQNMMLRGFSAELADARVRFHELQVLTPLAGVWPHYPTQEGWVSPDEVGDCVARIVAPTFEQPDTFVHSLPDPDSPRVWWRPKHTDQL